jgi:riboflavin kinase / FMN adenylyltransferase
MQGGHDWQVWHGLDEAADSAAAFGRSVVTIGVFDGVHRGHQRIVHRALARAAELRLPAVGVTFDPLPELVLRPQDSLAMLTTLERRVELMGELGLDAVWVVPFTRDFAETSPETFVQRLLVGNLHAVDVIVGANFRFGQRAAGDVSTLRDLGQSSGFMVDAVELAGRDGSVGPAWSSTWIRQHILAGDVEGAAEVLGRPHRLEGIVVHGDHRGRELGYPTANLDLVPHSAIPADGVYAGWLDGLPAAISIGTNPTFPTITGTDRRIEAHVIDRQGLDLYGHRMALDLAFRLREIVAFDGVDALVDQIDADVDRARRLLAAADPGSIRMPG